MIINSKTTKAQLVSYVEELEAVSQANALALAAAQPVPVKEQLARVANELIALVEDTYRLGAWCRKGFDRLVAELRSI